MACGHRGDFGQEFPFTGDQCPAHPLQRSLGVISGRESSHNQHAVCSEELYAGAGVNALQGWGTLSRASPHFSILPSDRELSSVERTWRGERASSRSSAPASAAKGGSFKA